MLEGIYLLTCEHHTPAWIWIEYVLRGCSSSISWLRVSVRVVTYKGNNTHKFGEKYLLTQ